MITGTWGAFSAAFRRMWADPTAHVGELYSHALVFGDAASSGGGGGGAELR